MIAGSYAYLPLERVVFGHPAADAVVEREVRGAGSVVALRRKLPSKWQSSLLSASNPPLLSSDLSV